ncbi:SDR family NAD(P)-dependent oxidoreductase [Actinomadura macrotermitis]|uniref:2-succinylbenzoate--CoA ligase n=1 Tax=Actinomadura macrotermitis TaxID=2585200 RepID=A0A7K0C2C0_9ACTN|nr:SDR family NAD(P)-dependent oxidoreductase [Actinomadura macrotermitis]MQY06974.1 2-succinylbenzoate--CoA ligase [Actinomadura macrotermitis]
MRRRVLDALVNPSWTVADAALENAVRGRTVLVTGASFGLGEATARGLARAGARVLLVARSAGKLAEVADEIRRDGGEAHAYPADLSDPDAVAALVDKLLAEHGRIDVLVSNAGKSMRRSVALQTDRFSDFTRTIGVNYLGPVRLVIALLPSMREHGGHIVNVSTAGVRIFPGPRWGAYQASKGAFDIWLRSITPEIRRDGVAVTTLYMGLIYTRMSAPTPVMRRLPGLAPEQAAGLVYRAVIDRPRAISPWWAGPAELLTLMTRGVQAPFLSQVYRFSRDTPSALAFTGATPERRVGGGQAAQVARLLRTGAPVLRRAGVVAPLSLGTLRGMARAFQENGVSLATLAGIAAARWPGRVAVADERGRLTYRELDDRVRCLAGGLSRRHAIGPGRTVAVLCRNHRGFVEASLAASALGADLLPLNTEFPGPQLAQTLDRHPPAMIVADEEFRPVLADAGYAGPLVLAWEGDGPSPAKEQTLDALIAQDLPAPPRPEKPGRVVILSSGTTGAPKGIGRTPSPAGLIGPLISAVDRLGLRSGDPFLIAPPLFHGFGLIYLALALFLGSPAVLRRRFDAGDALRVIEEEKVAALAAVPVMLQRIMDLPQDERSARDTSSLRAVLTGGAPVRPATVTAFLDAFGPVLANGYGSSEVGIATIAGPADLRAAPGTVGRPVLGVPVRILDHRGRPVPAGTTGRIFVGGAMAATDRAGSAARADGLVDSGDLGHLDETGLLFIDGRSDDMIVSGGENVFPQEVEDLLAAHPAVADAAVLGVPDPDFGQRLIAFVVPAATAGTAGLDETLKGHVKKRLARYKAPREVHLVAEIPRTPTGKILRRTLKEGLTV